MRLSISKTYKFEAAHYLPNVPDGHKCKRLHGHNYVVRIDVSGKIGSESGFCNDTDFADMDRVVKPVLALLDHRLLNEVEGLGNPTAEHIALFLLASLQKSLHGLTSVQVHETDSCFARADAST
jgi:6-pyruvoyltetrahydropterin/6-carboxytetrahydropterin synthase